jgi:uncharacterized protein (TIGR02271 family)
MSSDVIENWDNILHKNVRSKDMDGVGNVAAINDDDSISIITQGSRHMYKIPKSTIEGYNGAEVFLDLSAAEMANYDINSKSQDNTEESTITTTAKSATRISSTTTTTQTQTQIPTMTERLVASKRETTGEEITIIKEPATETRTIQVQVAHQEATIERRLVNKASSEEQTGQEGPVETRKEIKIPLMKEEIEISKQPYVKEEVIIRKKPVIETRTVTEEVKSEKVKVR